MCNEFLSTLGIIFIMILAIGLVVGIISGIITLVECDNRSKSTRIKLNDLAHDVTMLSLDIKSIKKSK